MMWGNWNWWGGMMGMMSFWMVLFFASWVYALVLLSRIATSLKRLAEDASRKP